jgi:hypothetical protein
VDRRCVRRGYPVDIIEFPIVVRPSMHCRRCSRLLLDLREVPEFRLDLLMQGGTGLAFTARTVALAPHLGVESELDDDEARVLCQLRPHQAESHAALVEQYGAAVIDRLLESGLLLGDHPRTRRTARPR